jgi:6-pyruvoyltetrahydropterin/6-carboxytetrahydropterin synthase
MSARHHYTVTRYHDISCGHRVTGHEGACANLHGHNYRIFFTCESLSAVGNKELDEEGRVVDFRVIKELLCSWLDAVWDHRFLVWVKDPWATELAALDPKVVVVPFNPTAENMAAYLVREMGPILLRGKGVSLFSVTVEETRKCSATYSEKPNGTC